MTVTDEPTEPAKVDLETPDLAAAHRAAFEQQFPGVLADGVIDAERLKELLDVDVIGAADDRERYGLMWAGKKEAVRSLQTQSRGTLIPDFDASVDWDAAQHVFIEGDNLEVLKLLQKAYNDRVKLIYIDPPYNTGGSDFIYPDDFSDSLRAYLEFSGQLDASGNRRSTDTDNLGRRHSRWLSMMYPRLLLARNLLKQDGAIFISIDDNEVANLRALMDEVFGPECFVASVIWRKKASPDARSTIGAVHDYLLCYVRNGSDPKSAVGKMALSEKRRASFSNPDNDPRGPWASVDMTGMTGRATKDQYFTVTLPSGREVGPPEGRSWGLVERTFEQLRADDRIWFGRSGDSVPRMKRFLSEAEGQTVPSYWESGDVGTNEEASDELLARFGGSKPFETPKPVRLMRRLLEISTRPSAGDIVLDFFAGSGAMADAVLQQNAEDGGNRRFVAVQLPEPTGRSDYATVAEITIARIETALGEVSPESGLRIERLASSNFRDRTSVDAEDLLDLRESTLDDGEHVMEYIAQEVLLKEGVRLDATWERHKASNAQVIVADGVAVVMSLELTQEIADAALALEPKVVVFLEDGFAGADAVKANTFTNAKNANIVMKTV